MLVTIRTSERHWIPFLRSETKKRRLPQGIVKMLAVKTMGPVTRIVTMVPPYGAVDEANKEATCISEANYRCHC